MLNTKAIEYNFGTILSRELYLAHVDSLIAGKQTCLWIGRLVYIEVDIRIEIKFYTYEKNAL